jgi:predicted nucleic acid-binding protein
MSSLLIDSDILIDFSRGIQATADYLASASATNTLAISIITQMELMVGCRDKQALQALDRFLTRFESLPITEEICTRAIDLLKQYNLSHGLLIPDAFIAATALQYSYPLVTKNQRDFRFIPELSLPSPP